MSLSVDPKNVYNPPNTLQYPGLVDDAAPRPESPASTSSSHSDLSSPSFNRDSELELNPKLQETSQTTKADNVIIQKISFLTFYYLSANIYYAIV